MDFFSTLQLIYEDSSVKEYMKSKGIDKVTPEEYAKQREKDLWPMIHFFVDMVHRKEMKTPYVMINLKDLKVLIVDFDKWKVKKEMDIVEGGNFMVYDFIPKGQIWIDSNLDRHEWKYVILHEMIECELMQEFQLDYLKAHEYANEVEKIFRKRI